MKDLIAKVKSNQMIAENTYMITFVLPESAGDIRGGQFVNLSVGDSSHLLRRPLGICIAVCKEISVCYQLKGEGTKKHSKIKTGDSLNVLLPLGNGFDLSGYKNIAVIGGGVGIFPLIAAIRENIKHKNFYSYIGFRSKSALCLINEFDKCKSLTVTTDDGSYGKSGNAVDAFFEDVQNLNLDAIIACGPPSMLKSPKEKLLKNAIDVPCFVSLEERMGCGVGACLVCVCKKNDGNNARVCKDGPVFNINDVVL